MAAEKDLYGGYARPAMRTGGFTSAQTAATGTNWTAYASQECNQLTIKNDTGTGIVVRQDGAGVEWPIADGTSDTFFGLENANQIAVKRADNSNTQVTVKARWEGI